MTNINSLSYICIICTTQYADGGPATTITWPRGPGGAARVSEWRNDSAGGAAESHSEHGDTAAAARELEVRVSDPPGAAGGLAGAIRGPSRRAEPPSLSLGRSSDHWQPPSHSRGVRQRVRSARRRAGTDSGPDWLGSPRRGTGSGQGSPSRWAATKPAGPISEPACA